jgi:hypothetical protein
MLNLDTVIQIMIGLPISTSPHILYGIYTEKLTTGRSEEVWTVCRMEGNRRCEEEMKKSDNRGMHKGTARDNKWRTE